MLQQQKQTRPDSDTGDMGLLSAQPLSPTGSIVRAPKLFGGEMEKANTTASFQGPSSGSSSVSMSSVSVAAGSAGSSMQIDLPKIEVRMPATAKGVAMSRPGLRVSSAHDGDLTKSLGENVGYISGRSRHSKPRVLETLWHKSEADERTKPPSPPIVEPPDRRWHSEGAVTAAQGSGASPLGAGGESGGVCEPRAWRSDEPRSNAEIERLHAYSAFMREVDGLLRSARRCRWHVVCTVSDSSGDAWHGDTDADQCLAEPLEIPEDAVAVLVIADFRCTERAAKLMRGWKSRRQPMPPVIGLLVDAFGETAEVAPILEAQQTLLASGAEEVLWKPADEWEAALSIAMAVVRAKERRQTDHNRDQQLRALRGQLKEQQELQREPNTGLFWQAVPRTFDGFPGLQTRLPKTLAPRAFVGPCRLENAMGHGTFGIVYSATNMETGEAEAVKVIEKESLTNMDRIIDLWKEMKALKRLDHPNIVAMHEAMHGPRHIFLFLEQAGSMNLFRELKASGNFFDLDRARGYQAQLTSAVAHCHSNGVAHRDLKPENICVSECKTMIKVIDFGAATSVSKPANDMLGTMPFLAPEAMRSSTYSPAACDVWSSGIILLEMICGIGIMDKLLNWTRNCTPCELRSRELDVRFSDGSVVREVLEATFDQVDDDLVQMLTGMLKVDPPSRWTAEEVERAAWLQPAMQQLDAA
mmetsp:Transcript_69006/g.173847  ORF Transcript_69006/g.173847 Transcript_69006/m.173847 type:complete len:698 (+) Transcript_69006:86-2179(+)